MAKIQDINVTIKKGNKALKGEDFGKPLILGNTNAKAGTYREYSSLTDLQADYADTTPEYKMMEAICSQTQRPPVVGVYSRATGTSITVALNTLVATNNSWYAILIPERDKASLDEAADWASSHEKLFFGCSSEKDGSGNFTALEGRNSDRDIRLIHDVPLDYPECAWAAIGLSSQPGSITWKWKQLQNQTTCGFTTTELNQIRTKKSQALQEQSGAIFVNEGKAMSGEYIDVVHGMDWIKDQLEIGLLALFLNNDKVPMDNSGIALVENVIRGVLTTAGEYGIIAMATTDADYEKSDDNTYMYKLYMPTRDQVPANDRANRILTGVKFEYTLAGAIHEAQVTGTIII